MKSERLHLFISGRVQGVGYRSSLQREATARHVTGWVRNLPDGQVEALVCGSAFALASLLDWAHQGPPGARVDAIHSSPAENGPTEGFRILPDPGA
ncbi:acylphosphatase [Azovibrio restrictus]|uniref:acylphosphatase n=1 Tax=Azovibrio restrictus TaxID=146938 RepID=UPI0026EA0523|nr:acylphosphatase [Azovibrio restrictus]